MGLTVPQHFLHYCLLETCLGPFHFLELRCKLDFKFSPINIDFTRYHKLGFDWATSLLGFLSLLLLPIPFVYFYKGETLRWRSPWARYAINLYYSLGPCNNVWTESISIRWKTNPEIYPKIWRKYYYSKRIPRISPRHFKTEILYIYVEYQCWLGRYGL